MVRSPTQGTSLTAWILSAEHILCKDCHGMVSHAEMVAGGTSVPKNLGSWTQPKGIFVENSGQGCKCQSLKGWAVWQGSSTLWEGQCVSSPAPPAGLLHIASGMLLEGLGEMQTCDKRIWLPKSSGWNCCMAQAAIASAAASELSQQKGRSWQDLQTLGKDCIPAFPVAGSGRSLCSSVSAFKGSFWEKAMEQPLSFHLTESSSSAPLTVDSF